MKNKVLVTVLFETKGGHVTRSDRRALMKDVAEVLFHTVDMGALSMTKNHPEVAIDNFRVDLVGSPPIKKTFSTIKPK